MGAEQTVAQATLAEPLLVGSGLGRDFGGVAALRKVDMAVQQGEIFGIIGPNGAGKTTLLNLISGVFRPTFGTLQYKGRVLNGLQPHVIARLGIARTFQVTKPFRGLTVLENVAIGALFGAAHRRSMPAARVKAGEVLQEIGIWDRRDTLASDLTVAGQKRLELARALATDAQVVLLDEVMAGLNQTEVETMMGLIRQVNQRGVTVLVVEHVMKAIMGICHRVMVLHHGEKLAEGTPQTIVQDPRVIQAYLGTRSPGGAARATGA